MVVREDRKEQIMDKAVGIFAELGYYKATTALVAKAAGVTQPYVFHFFKNKEELFNAVIDRSVSRLYETFSQVEAPADQLMDTMGHAFMEIMHVHRDEIMMVMQSYTISEPVIRDHVREKFRIIHKTIVAKFEKAGIPDAEAAASQFFSMGFLITVSEVLNLPDLLCFKD
ncbi:TetR/AcrR family transcriptional regulator [Paenibacillus sp. GCM10027628]|uniref:TetR/AcrR family transcriptional regulator n=1 Tax=Paenibacillus sp. GCM10027628 TaxID=3273413 RepID=UPI0036382D97